VKRPYDSRPARPDMSKLAVLKLGFGAMVALLVFSAVEGYRIQEQSSRNTAAICQRFVETGEQLSHMRRLLFAASLTIRDYLFCKEAVRSAAFRSELRDLADQTRQSLQTLEHSIGRRQTVELREKINGFLGTVELTIPWPDEQRAAAGFAFIQSEIAPRRGAVSGVLRELMSVNQQLLETSRQQFAASWRAAAARLSIMLVLCIVIGVVVAHASVGHVSRLEAQSIRRFEEVTQAKEELARLSARLLQVQEDERRRLSRELHDEIGQTLTALRIEISHARDAWRAGSPSLSARLNEAHSLAERTVNTIRDISLLLRPSLLDDLGLEPALQQQVEDFSRRSGIRCTLEQTSLDDTLPDSVKTCVYRAVQEALNNCEKHSGASWVRIQALQDGPLLSVEIADNGVGFEVKRHGAALGPGLGLIGMRERVAALGGRLTLVSAPGKGTKLGLTIPLRSHAGFRTATVRAEAAEN